MLGRTHMAIGAFAGLMALQFLPFHDTLLFMGVAIAASLLPDIDHHGARIHKLFVVTRLVPKIVKHRGVFHSVWPALAGFLLLDSFTEPLIAWAFLVGYGSHLLSDCFTKDGLDLLRPFMRFRIAGPVRTGSWHEHIVLLGTIIGIVLRLAGRI